MIISRQTRIERTGPAVENLSKRVASVTSGVRSPTYREAIELAALVLFIVFFCLLIRFLCVFQDFFGYFYC